MAFRIDLLITAALVASSGAELIAPDALPAAHQDRPCQPAAEPGAAARAEAEQRILAEGYDEVVLVARDCGNVWHARALADGDPVELAVTPLGAVVPE